MWKHGSLPDCLGKNVIPIEFASTKFVKYKVTQIRGVGGSSRYFPLKVELADWFPIEPAFSVTIHKALVSNPFVFRSSFIHDSYVHVCLKFNRTHPLHQGRTIAKIILSLLEHRNSFTQISWEGLYVALSRVKLRGDICLLLKGGTDPRWTTLKTLPKCTRPKLV